MANISVAKILSMHPEEIGRLSIEEIRPVLQSAAKAANQRLRRLEKGMENGVYSAAYQSLEHHRGETPRFTSSKKLSRNQAIAELFDIRQFLGNKSATVKGAKEIQNRVQKRLGGNLSPEMLKKVFTAYNKVKETDPYFTRVYGSDRLQQEISNMVTERGLEVDDIVQEALARIDADYEEKESQF